MPARIAPHTPYILCAALAALLGWARGPLAGAGGAEGAEGMVIAPRPAPLSDGASALVPAFPPHRETESPKSGEALVIAFSPTAQAEWSAREVQAALELLRAATGGGENAQRKWRALGNLPRARALVRALNAGHEALRRRAVKELAADDWDSGEDGDEVRGIVRRALAKAAVREPKDEIRKKAQKAWQGLAQADGKEALAEMAAGLDLPNVLDRRRAFNALKAVGGGGVAEVLVTKITQRWGKGPRNHILIARQRSYIADYDVSGAVFDPVIKSFLTGVVLDSRILEIEITRYIIEHLRNLKASEAVLKNPKRWRAFLQAQRAAAGR